MNEWMQKSGWKMLTEENRRNREKCSPSAILSTVVTHRVTWDWARPAADGRRWRNAPPPPISFLEEWIHIHSSLFSYKYYELLVLPWLLLRICFAVSHDGSRSSLIQLQIKNIIPLLVRTKTKRKVKANFTLEQATKTLRESRSLVLLFLEHRR